MIQLYASPTLEQTIESLMKNLQTHPTQIIGRTRRIYLTLELLHSSCDLNCYCKCHSSLQQDSHWSWNGLLGYLLNGYTAKPILSLVCNISDCQSQSSKITFAFPTWFWYRALSLSTGLFYRPGPEMLICFPPSVAKVILAMLFGPELWLRSFHRHELLNKLSNFKYMIDSTPLGKDEGAHISRFIHIL